MKARVVQHVFLKRILLHGFKSFADRTEFDFGSGITGVVGPNGCGKSNILDAVRWVLGAQSARSLRGGKMADVIFSGSRTRKPANSAHVELTFDNRVGFLASDQAEVTVGRLLFRNGDSEYRLNGSTCRLKDVRHLFLDTGVGVDAYSIIGQGRVDSLLQADPVQRREIFEEAAGISRYKVQRAEAQRKLERTQNNLLRLNDVIEELEKRLRSVKLAAGKARRWREHDTRLRELRASFSLAEFHDLETIRQATQEKTAGLNEKLHAERAELSSRDAEAAELERSSQQLDEQIQALDARLAALQSEHSALTERISQSERRVGDLVTTRDRRRTQVSEIAERLTDLERRVQEETTTVQALAEAAQRGSGRIVELQHAHGEAAQRRDGSRASLDQAKTAAFETVRRSALLRNEQNNLAGQRDRLKAQREHLEARRTTLEAEQGELTRRQGEAAERVELLDRNAAELTGEVRNSEAQLGGLRTAGEAVESEIGAAKERRSAVLSRLDLLEDMERRLEGVDQGTQAVLSWRDDEGTAGGVLGLVADLLRIDDPRVQILQPLLSTFENHVVVANAGALLGELARRAELPGPVRVFALDRIPSEWPRADYESAPGFVARAADWVTCGPELRGLAEHLLGRVIIVDEAERALALAAGAPSGYVFATLDGRMVSADGVLTVGATKAAAGLISRKAEIRQLDQQRDEIETNIEQATRRKNEIEQQLADTQLRRDELLNQIAGVQREHAEARMLLTRVDGESVRLQREAEATDGELEGVRRAVAEIEEQAERLAAETAAAGEAERTHETQIGALASELDEFEASLARLAGELTEAKVEAGRALEKKSAGEEALARLHASQAALRREQSEAEREAEEAVRQIAAAETECEAARGRQAECAAEAQRGEAGVRQQRERRQDIRVRIENCGALVRTISERIRQIEAEVHECDVTLRETDVRRENLVARIRDELDLDLVECYARYEHAEQDWEAIKAEIAELREKIARLGHVNLEAITELEELTPRFENLTTQRDDLLASVARLQTLIEELDQESRTRFAAAFEQIRENFHELFRKLFGGGKADIILEDPERPLECGVEIIARPPGKELQSISLLSGGEKTMTAVALVMAVFKSKPSPFAFLDEVDAALDEANTERFNTMLQEFLSQSQFVVITHSKRTMQSADVLYGVTMEEPGVSKRVSVRFDNDRVQTPSVA